MTEPTTNAEMSSTKPETLELRRSVSLAGGVSIVVGGVIGMGIYVLIASVASQAGYATWLAFSLAIVVSLLGVLPVIQMASALPRAGGGYFFTSRLVSPLAGTLTSSWAVLGGAATTAVVATGLAEYIVAYTEWNLPPKAVALALPVALFCLYLGGLNIAMSMQVIMAAQLVIALLLYAGFGAAHSSLAVGFVAHQGWGGFVTATILCYTVCIGFQVVAELGEEMHDAQRNIPLSLLIGAAIVLVIYIAVSTVFIASMDGDFSRMASMAAPLNESGEAFLPGPLLTFLALGALSAGLTSLNAAATAIPRELFAMARDGVAPLWMGRVHKRTGTPLNAVAVFFALVMVFLIFGNDIDLFAIIAAVGIMFMTVAMAFAAVRLPRVMPERYAKAYFKLSPLQLRLLAGVCAISSLGFVAVVAMERPIVMAMYAGWTAAVGLYYFLRVRYLRRVGFDFDARVKSIPGTDEET